MADWYVRIGAISGLVAITAEAARLAEWGRRRLLDSTVDLYLRRQVTATIRTMRRDEIHGVAKSVEDIAAGSKVPRWLVIGCLKRLHRGYLVVPEQDGKWRTINRRNT
jgi:hypothetical protein